MSVWYTEGVACFAARGLAFQTVIANQQLSMELEPIKLLTTWRQCQCTILSKSFITIYKEGDANSKLVRSAKNVRYRYNTYGKKLK